MKRPSREVTGISLLLLAGAFVDIGRRVPVAVEPADQIGFRWLIVICSLLGLFVGTGTADRWRARTPMLIGIGLALLASLGQLGDLWPESYVLWATANGALVIGSLVLGAEIVTGDPDAPLARRFASTTAFLLARHAIHAAVDLVPTSAPHPFMAIGALVDAFVLVMLIPKWVAPAEPQIPQSPYRAAPIRLPKPMPSAASLEPLGALILPVACLAFATQGFLRASISALRLGDLAAVIGGFAGAAYFARVAMRGEKSATPLRLFSASLVCAAVVLLPAWLISSSAVTAAAMIGGLGGAFAQIAGGYVVLSTRQSSALPLAAWLAGQWVIAWFVGNLLYVLPIAVVAAGVSLFCALRVYRQAPALQARFE